MTSDRLLIIAWSALPAWDLKTARAAAFRRENPRSVPLSRFAEEATVLAHPSREPDVDWDVYGVSNSEGVHFSHHQPGKEFNSPYKKIERDWFFHNPTRANVGSLGRVPAVGDRAVTSPEYQVWRLTQGLSPDFVELLISTRYFLRLVDLHRVGAVKQRLFVRNLLEIPIPAFTLDEQRTIVAFARDSRQRAAAIRSDAGLQQQRAERDYLARLGLGGPQVVSTHRKVFVELWSKLGRWTVRYHRAAQAGLAVEKATYPIRALRDLLESSQYGTSKKAASDPNATPVLRIGNIKNGRIDTSDLKYVRLSDRERGVLLLRDGDILIIRTSGSRGLVGTCGVFHENASFVFASYLIRLRLNGEAIPDFVTSFINSPVGREQVELMSRHIMQNNINAEEIGDIQVPLPPMKVQRAIMKDLRTALDGVARLRAEAERLDDSTNRMLERALASADVRLLKG